MSEDDLPIRLEIPRDISEDVQTLMQRGVDVDGLTVPELCAAINELRRSRATKEVTEERVDNFMRAIRVLALVSEIEQLDSAESETE